MSRAVGSQRDGKRRAEKRGAKKERKTNRGVGDTDVKEKVYMDNGKTSGTAKKQGGRGGQQDASEEQGARHKGLAERKREREEEKFSDFFGRRNPRRKVARSSGLDPLF